MDTKCKCVNVFKVLICFPVRWVRCGSFHKPKNVHWSLADGELCEAQSGLCLGAKDNELVMVSPSDLTGQWEMETFEAFRQRHYASFSH